MVRTSISLIRQSKTTWRRPNRSICSPSSTRLSRFRACSETICSRPVWEHPAGAPMAAASLSVNDVEQTSRVNVDFDFRRGFLKRRPKLRMPSLSINSGVGATNNRSYRGRLYSTAPTVKCKCSQKKRPTRSCAFPIAGRSSPRQLRSIRAFSIPPRHNTKYRALTKNTPGRWNDRNSKCRMLRFALST